MRARLPSSRCHNPRQCQPVPIRRRIVAPTSPSPARSKTACLPAYLIALLFFYRYIGYSLASYLVKPTGSNTQNNTRLAQRHHKALSREQERELLMDDIARDENIRRRAKEVPSDPRLATLQSQRERQRSQSLVVAINSTTLLNLERSVELPTTSKGNDEPFLLDAVMLQTLPRIYPARFTSVQPCRSESQLVHAQWVSFPKRHYGIGPNASDTSNGASVQGTWPDLARSLTYLPILKNAHTTVANAIGDLRQRLEANVAVVQSQSREAMDKILLSDANPIVTILRDPVDRFISAICEDLRLSMHKMQICFDDNIEIIHDRLDCLFPLMEVSPKQNRKCTSHVTPQYLQLYNAMSLIDKPVSVLFMEQVEPLLTELGHVSSSTRLRDRKVSDYYMTAHQWANNEAANRRKPWAGMTSASRRQRDEEVGRRQNRLSDFCKLRPKDLRIDQIETICRLYHQDVNLLRAVGHNVDLCA